MLLPKNHAGETRGWPAVVRQAGIFSRSGLCRLPLSFLGLAVLWCGCRTPQKWREQADRVVADTVSKTQMKVLGHTEKINVDSPADTLRKRLLLAQKLPHTDAASRALRDLQSTEFWDRKTHLPPVTSKEAPWFREDGYHLSLTDALQIAARNSREFQNAKDRVFRTALDLDLERDAFRNTFTAMLSSLFRSTDTDEGRHDGVNNGADVSVSRRFRNGTELTGSIAVDLVKVLTQDRPGSLGLFGDASISIPLLRGSGRKIVEEPLRQAERNMVYSIYEFERFKRQFAVGIATDYLDVLLAERRIVNEAENYKRLITTTRRTRRLSDSGRRKEFEFDQAVQNELQARNRWILARHSHQRSLDRLKMSLGLPPDAKISLEEGEIQRMQAAVITLVAGIKVADYSGKIPPADAPITLPEPDRHGAGPLEMDPEKAIRIALEHRLDLRVARGRVEDAQRNMMVAADRLRAELTLLGRASAGETRSIGTAELDNADFDISEATWSALLTLDLPFERTRERNQYRESLIQLEESVRSFQAMEDQIKFDVRDRLRSLSQARSSLLIQAQAVRLAKKRVKSTNMFMQAGRAATRDVLDAQEDLLRAQNSLVSAAVDYRTTEWELQRDLGMLDVTVDGIWREFRPERDTP